MKDKNNKKDKKIPNNAFSPVMLTISPEQEINTDPFGSYTGVPTDDPYDKPVQDADDL